MSPKPVKAEPTIDNEIRDQKSISLGFEVNLKVIKEKENILEVKKIEVQQTVEVKRSLEVEVASVQEEVRILQAKVDEKNRRTVKVKSSAPNSAGNTYVAGNCTWFAKSKRPDLPNRMGDAKYWYASAQKQGFLTGTESRKGAIGVNFEGRRGHVVYVEEWYANGTVKVSEMNFKGLYVVSSRIAPESEFKYIYEKT